MDKLSQAIQESIALVAAGDTTTAIDKIIAFKQDTTTTRFTLIRTLISTGQARSDAELTRCALDAFERIKAKAPNDPDTYYDVANGYQVLYDCAAAADPTTVFDCERVINEAIKYFHKAGDRDPRVLTNLGNLYDAIGRPVESIACYEHALAREVDFAMAAANKAQALELLAPTSRYPTMYRIHAHQLYQAALGNAQALRDTGGPRAVDYFQARDDAIVRHYTAAGRADVLDADLTHRPYDDSELTDFVRFYTEVCVRKDLYLNLHIVDRRAQASIGDRLVPRLRRDLAKVTNSGMSTTSCSGSTRSPSPT